MCHGQLDGRQHDDSYFLNPVRHWQQGNERDDSAAIHSTSSSLDSETFWLFLLHGLLGLTIFQVSLPISISSYILEQ